MPYRFIALLFLLVTLVTACERHAQQEAELFVFGTIVGITIRGVDEATADAAMAELQIRFTALHNELHAWKEGPLTRVNSAFREGRSVQATTDIIRLIQRSRELEQQSSGAFNPAIGGLIALWGFHTSTYPITGPPPAQEQIEAWLKQAPSTRDIQFDEDRLYSSNPAVQLDFGGIAKGLAVDIAIELLRRHGIDNAIVNAGGDLRVIGDAGPRPWRVAIKKPGGGGVLGVLESKTDMAVFTSGSGQRYREHAEQRYPHILDPRSGQPARGLSSVTVLAREGLSADAAATALFVAGPDHWPRMAAALGLDEVLVVKESGAMQLTPAMNQRFEPDEVAGQVPEVVELP
jgi:thiamine biosynthesis lipoprotein